VVDQKTLMIPRSIKWLSIIVDPAGAAAWYEYQRTNYYF
jgi:hypothetical protein